MKFSIQKIADFLKGTIEGNPVEEITNIAKIEEAKRAECKNSYRYRLHRE